MEHALGYSPCIPVSVLGTSAQNPSERLFHGLQDLAVAVTIDSLFLGSSGSQLYATSQISQVKWRGGATQLIPKRRTVRPLSPNNSSVRYRSLNLFPFRGWQFKPSLRIDLPWFDDH